MASSVAIAPELSAASAPAVASPYKGEWTSDLGKQFAVTDERWIKSGFQTGHRDRFIRRVLEDSLDCLKGRLSNHLAAGKSHADLLELYQMSQNELDFLLSFSPRQ